MTADLAKVRAYLRRMGHQYVFAMLDEAVGMLPKAKLEALVRRYINLKAVQKDPPPRDLEPGLLAEVTDFAARSRRGDYFESFNVNSKNYTEQSNGTTAWIADCNRLLDRCVARVSVARGRCEALASFEILFDLIDLAASCNEDIVFFADEGGLWSFGIDWKPVFEAWAACAAEVVVDDDVFEARLAKVLTRFGKGELGMSATVARRARRAAKAAKTANRSQ